MPACYVSGCSNKSKTQSEDVTLHCFPRERDRIEVWLRFCGVEEDKIHQRIEEVVSDAKSYRFRICSIHFSAEQFDFTAGGRFKKGRLKAGSVPNINIPSVAIGSVIPSTSQHSHNKTQSDLISTQSQTFNTSIGMSDMECQATVMCADKACQVNMDEYEATLKTDVLTDIPEHELIYDADMTKVKKDHTYQTRKSKPPTRPSILPMHESTPIKGGLSDLLHQMQTEGIVYESAEDTFEETMPCPVVQIASSEPMEESVQSAQDNTKQDPDYSEESIPAGDSFSERNTNYSEEIVCEKKYLVFSSCLLELFRMIKCSHMIKGLKRCGKPLINLNTEEFGSCLEVKACCFDNHRCIEWKSQPMNGRFRAGNLLIGSAILFSGLTFEKAALFAGFLGMEFISSSSFYKYQRTYLFPSLHEAWEHEKMNLEMLYSKTKIKVSGDGQFDSPGFSAKYCVYTVMEQSKGKIICVKVVQVTECTSSVAMEKLALQRALAELEDRGFLIEVLTTDRHVSIAKMMRDLFKHIKHQFDLWHFAKSLKKKVTEASRKKGCKELAMWSQSITNHLWWCSRTCNKSLQLLLEKWTSLLFHTTNKHHWIGSTLFHNCEHAHIEDEEQRKKKWLKADTPAHDALIKIVHDKTLKRVLSGLTEFTHTGALEVFHSNVLRVRPKLSNFSIDGILARTVLAILAHNANTGRSQARKKTKNQADDGDGGELRYKVVYPKGRSRWIAKKIFEDYDYGYVYDLLMHVLDMSRLGLETTWEPMAAEMPKNIAKVKAPKKADVIAGMVSRF